MQADLKPLEFNAIRRMLERLCATPYGADAARGLEPAPDLGVAGRMQRAVDAARALIEAGRRPSLGALPDIRAALRQASTVGSSLSGQALFNLQEVMSACDRLAEALPEDTSIFPGSLEELRPPQELASLLKETLVGAGTLREDANEALSTLFAERRHLRDDAERLVLKRMQCDDVKDLFAGVEKASWQNERAVVVVRAVASDRIKGVRRGSALGGRDVTIEPMEAIAANNRLETVMGQIGTEQQRLFRSVTSEVRAHGQALQLMIDALTWIDLALAAGQLSQMMGGRAPRLTDVPEVELNGVYHPLLLAQFIDGTGTAPVPLTIRLDGQDRLLVITGPNTGGKTVALKTLGLVMTMAYCGLHIPAEGDCVVGHYERLIVDVGDHQSLHHHLSTFAGHVEVLKRVLQEADGHTMVLLDELGTGTDPEEGAALAMAVLDELGARGVQGIVNTHLSPLKEYASDREGLRNASMHFDTESLRPTYELRIGVPGESLGLTIAAQNGLSPALVAVARTHLQRLAERHH